MKSRSLGRLLRSFKLLARNDRGNVLILTAMGLPILIGGAGFGVDTAQWYLWKRELQTAVDAAALSGAFSNAQGFAWQTSAEQELARNIDVVSLKGRTVTRTNWNAGVNNAIVVTASTQRALPFSSMFLETAPVISATATAADIDDGKHCMIALDESTDTSVSVGGNALLELGCGIGSRGRGAEAIKFFGSSQVEASPISAVGGITAEDKNLIGDSTIRPYSLAPKNPFEGLSTPTNGTARTYSANGKNTVALQPGTYSGGIDLKGPATLAPGTYVVDGGCLCANATESLTGSGVTIVLKNGATIDINGSANINLTAPTSGAHSGILIWEDAATAGSVSKTSKINGNSTLHLGGAIYLPTQTMQMNGNTTPTTECLLLASKKIDVSGSASIRNDCPPDHVFPGDNGAPVVRLVK